MLSTLFEPPAFWSRSASRLGQPVSTMLGNRHDLVVSRPRWLYVRQSCSNTTTSHLVFGFSTTTTLWDATIVTTSIRLFDVHHLAKLESQRCLRIIDVHRLLRSLCPIVHLWRSVLDSLGCGTVASIGSIIPSRRIAVELPCPRLYQSYVFMQV